MAGLLSQDSVVFWAYGLGFQTRGKKERMRQGFVFDEIRGRAYRSQ